MEDHWIRIWLMINKLVNILKKYIRKVLRRKSQLIPKMKKDHKKIERY